MTLSGVILDFVLAPANVLELHAGQEVLEEHTDLETLGDKAFVSAPVAERLWTENRVRLLTIPRRNEQRQVPKPLRRLLNGARQVAETVNSQLAEQFHIEVNHAQRFWGLTARLLTKLSAHTLCVHLNRLLGKPAVLHLKELAFPIWVGDWTARWESRDQISPCRAARAAASRRLRTPSLPRMLAT